MTGIDEDVRATENHIQNSDINEGDSNNTPEQNTLDFSCEYSANIPQILKNLNISLAFTSYQAGRLMFVRSDGDSLDLNYKSFQRPMGLAATEQGLTLGTFTQVINFNRVDELVEKLKKPLQPIEEDITAPRITPKEDESADKLEMSGELDKASAGMQVAAEMFLNDEPLSEEDAAKKAEREEAQRLYQEQLFAPVDERVDACFITRSSHYSGMINLHDIAWGNDGLWVVNSSFSCLCTLDPDYSFVPQWKPHFISELMPEDRCHLNGMALKDGKPAYVTTFSTSDEVGTWRKGDNSCGTLMDVESNTILLDGLTMPHSPRWHRQAVYYCNSGQGQFCRYDPATKQNEVVVELQGFTRGIDFYGDIAFVGLSKLRQGNVLTKSPISEKYDETFSGIWLINLTDNTEIGYIKFVGNVDQIYDIAVVSDCCFPELLEPSHPRMRNHFCLPPPD